MTSFTDTWNATFEGLPPDTVEAAAQGASRIRAFKLAFRERLAVDHSIAGDSHDGKHKQVTFRVLGADPTLDAGDGAGYIKDVAGVKELFYKNSAGTVIQLTSTTLLPILLASGTRMLFQQTSAPTGWTKEASATYNDAALRFTTGTVGTGGADAFNTLFGTSKSTAGHTLAIAEIPSHTHGISTGAGTADTNNPVVPVPSASTGIVSTATGGGGSHSHTLNNMNLKWADCIIAAKN